VFVVVDVCDCAFVIFENIGCIFIKDSSVTQSSPQSCPRELREDYVIVLSALWPKGVCSKQVVPYILSAQRIVPFGRYTEGPPGAIMML